MTQEPPQGHPGRYGFTGGSGIVLALLAVAVIAFIAVVIFWGPWAAGSETPQGIAPGGVGDEPPPPATPTPTPPPTSYYAPGGLGAPAYTLI